jgi:hypothetical protein
MKRKKGEKEEAHVIKRKTLLHSTKPSLTKRTESNSKEKQISHMEQLN